MLSEKLDLKKYLINFLLEEGVDIRTNTKARGHLGIFSQNRIDINKKLDENKFVEVVLHEYAHFIHKKIESDMQKTGGTLENLFLTKDIEQIRLELEHITKLVDENSLFAKIDEKKQSLKKKVKALENEIKREYPNFQRSKPFKEFNKYIKKSEARFLLKYDRVKIITPFLRREKIISIANIRKDFDTMPESFINYIKLTSLMRKSKNLQSRKNRLNKYYSKPSELFARFVQGSYKHKKELQELAPITFGKFNLLLEDGHYHNLKKLIGFLEENNI